MNTRTRISIVLVLVVTGVTQAQLWNPLAIDKGQWSVGATYQTGDVDLESDAGGHASLDVDRAMIAAEYALADWLGIYAGGGMVQTDVLGFDDTAGSWLVGARTHHALSGPWSAGLVAQVQGWDAEDSETVEGLTETLEFSIVETVIAAAIQYTNGALDVYGGPYVVFISGDATDTLTDGVDTDRMSTDIEQDDIFGGFIGVRWEPAASWSIGAEYRSIGNTAIVGLSKSF